MSVSVLIVTYQSVHEIETCLRSLLPQIKQLEGEIVIVDNASTDGTIELLRNFEKKEDAITIIYNTENRSYAPANNQALKASTRDTIFYLNPDTQIQINTIESLLSMLESDAKLAAIAPQLRFPDGRIQYSCRRFPKHRDVFFNVIGLSLLFPQSPFFNGWKMGDFDHLSAKHVDQAGAAALMVKRDVLEKLNGFDEVFPLFFNDVDLCYRIHQEGYSILFYPYATVIHHAGISVKKRPTRAIISSHVAFFRFFEKH